jgi:hypothetical protein
MEGASSVSFDCNATVSNDDDDDAAGVDADRALPAAAILQKESMDPRRHRAIAMAILILSLGTPRSSFPLFFLLFYAIVAYGTYRINIEILAIPFVVFDSYT